MTALRATTAWTASPEEHADRAREAVECARAMQDGMDLTDTEYELVLAGLLDAVRCHAILTEIVTPPGLPFSGLDKLLG